MVRTDATTHATRGSRRFHAFGIGIGCSAVVLATVLCVVGRAPAVGPLLVFGGLVAFAENRGVEFPDGTTLSASSVPTMAAVVVFHAQGAPAGAMVVAMCGALYLPALRDHDIGRVLFHAGSYGLATLVVSLTFAGLAAVADSTGLALLLITLPVALVDLLVNDLLVAVAVALSRGRTVLSSLARFRPGSWQVVPFTLFGLVMGTVWVEFGAITLPLFIVPVVVAHRTFHAYQDLHRAHEATLETLLRALEAKDGGTARHVRRVAAYATSIGEDLGLTPARLERLRCAALMHDVGKLAVPSELLNKPGRLTRAEFERVHRHEAVSVAILERIDFLRDIAPSAVSEYSRYDGTDPPDSRGATRVLRTRRTPLEPHIVHVADAFDAMTSSRAYRRALDLDVALDELRRCAGTQFHPRCVEALVRVVQEQDPVVDVPGASSPELFAVPPPVVGTGSAGLGDLADAHATGTAGA